MNPYNQNPSYNAPPGDRPLPPGWVKEWNAQNNAWFYVNTMTNPPQSQWNHPADQHYSPPQGTPYGGGGGGPPPQGERGILSNLFHHHSHSNAPPPNAGYQQGPPGGYQQGPPGGYQQGPPGGYQQGPPGGYQQGRPQAPPSHGMSNGMKMGLGALGGIAAGAFIEHEWKEHEEREERRDEAAYEEGREQGMLQQEARDDNNGWSGGGGGGCGSGYGNDSEYVSETTTYDTPFGDYSRTETEYVDDQNW